MHLLEEIRQIKSGPKELKNFAHVVGGIFVFLGVVFLWRHKPFFGWPLGIGSLLLLMGFIAPAILRPLYIAWMSLGLILGAVVSPVIMGILFYAALTPVSLIARLCGKKFLDLDFKINQTSYWVPKKKRNENENKIHYESQF